MEDLPEFTCLYCQDRGTIVIDYLKNGEWDQYEERCACQGEDDFTEGDEGDDL